jgi:hypothetical protein
MTHSIHLETESTDLSVHRIRTTAETLYDLADSIYAAIAQTDWEGSSKDDFLFEVYRCTSTIKFLAESLDLLGFQLKQTTEFWELTASRFDG